MRVIENKHSTDVGAYFTFKSESSYRRAGEGEEIKRQGF